MLVVVRNEERLSLKANFIVQLLRQSANKQVFCVFRRESDKFGEKWTDGEVQLSSSILGLILYYSFVLLKSPKDTRNGLMVRLSLMKPKHMLIGEGFLSILSQTLYLHLGTRARANRLVKMLKKVKSSKVFLIDEFLSLNCIDLRRLRALGPLVYISQDTAFNRFGFGDNPITKALMYRLERDAVAHFDLVVACSEMERIKYLGMGAKKTIFYPNLYPTEGFEPCDKDETPSISIVLRGHWGFKAERSLETIFDALACINKQIRVYLIGIKPEKVPKNVKLEYWEFINSKLDYLKLISKSWAGINVGIHMAGTNERKYDYAEAGLTVISDKLGSRGDLLPYEYTYVDYSDLAAKMGQLLEFGRKRLTNMGEENRKTALSLAEKGRRMLLDNLSKLNV